MIKYIKSPINQMGRKHTLLPQILDYIPEHTTFMDMFVGSGDITVNNKAKIVHVNDNCKPLIDWLQEMRETPILEILDRLDFLIDTLGLSGDLSGKEPYLALRKLYNTKKDNSYLFYLLHSHGFSNGIRFNQDGGWNLPFGERTFNETMRQNMIEFVEVWQTKYITFSSKNFTELTYDADFTYADPPYSTGDANYSSTWKHDQELFEILDSIKGKWMMSNAIENNGYINQPLIDWSKKWDVIPIVANYKGCYYQRKNGGKTKEVIIKNY